jgi:hypothetical protein
VLNLAYVDLVNTNCVRVDTHVDGPIDRICDDLEEYMRYELHGSNVAQQVQAEDMKSENTYNDSTVLLIDACPA